MLCCRVFMIPKEKLKQINKPFFLPSLFKSESRERLKMARYIEIPSIVSVCKKNAARTGRFSEASLPQSLQAPLP